jgi:hypothetical protein
MENTVIGIETDTDDMRVLALQIDSNCPTLESHST